MRKFTRKDLGAGDLVKVTLRCMSCQSEMTINVSRERGLPKALYWECMECQKIAGDRYGRKRDPVRQADDAVRKDRELELLELLRELADESAARGKPRLP